MQVSSSEPSLIKTVTHPNQRAACCHRWTMHFSVQLFSSTELPSRGSMWISTYGRCEVAPSREAKGKNVVSCLSKISLSFRVLSAYSWWLCRVHRWYPDVTEFCHWFKWLISSTSFLQRAAFYRVPNRTSPISLQRGMSLWKKSANITSTGKFGWHSIDQPLQRWLLTPLKVNCCLSFKFR